MKFNTEIADWPLYVMPVRHHFLFGEGDRFDQLVIDFIKRLRTNGEKLTYGKKKFIKEKTKE